MIDTAAISLVYPDFRVTDPNLFRPKRVYPDGGWSRTQNSTLREKRANLRRPSLTWTSGRPGRPGQRLRIEASLPKLLFGDNRCEMEDSDAGVLLALLSRTLAGMGVEASPEALWCARISVLHVGKNVPLPTGMTCSAVNRELGSYPQRATWEQSQKTFENGGALFKLHRKDFEFVTYDKCLDIARSRRTPNLAGCAPAAPALLTGGEATATGAAILRVECRLNKPAEIRAALLRAGYEIEAPRLCDLFSSDVAMGVLLSQMERFEIPGGTGPGQDLAPLDVLSAFLKDGLKVKPALAAFALRYLEREVGSCAVRRVLKEHDVSDAAWYRLKGLRRGTGTGPTRSAVEVLRDAFVSYLPLRPTQPGNPTSHSGELPVSISTKSEGPTHSAPFQHSAETPPPESEREVGGISVGFALSGGGKGDAD